ncbi:MAG: DUF4886 domain-containing protein [Clostridia bacterium]|nr:DUF4886 domain-containing protein [Clostridia bacterium]
MKVLSRILSALIALAMLACLFTSCSKGSEKKGEGKDEDTPKQTESKVEEAESTEPELQSTVEQEDPAADGEMDVLIIGNSFSTGWPDELKGLFSSVRIPLNIYSVYYSGCSLEQHWTWFEEGKNNYRLNRHLDDTGKRKAVEGKTLLECLAAENWDVISLQQHFGPITAIDYDQSLDSCNPYAEKLFDYLKWNFPKTRLVFHETWAYEVGYQNTDKTFKLPDKEYQTKCYENIRDVSRLIATENKVSLVPCGDAWQIARQSVEVGDLTRDKYHDGPVGGGQYLNACVWFEVLTGQSCLGNTWRPSYGLNEYKVAALQQAAHQAVAENPVK